MENQGMARDNAGQSDNLVRMQESVLEHKFAGERPISTLRYTLNTKSRKLGHLAAEVLLNRIQNPSQNAFVTKNMKLSPKNPTLKNVVNHV